MRATYLVPLLALIITGALLHWLPSLERPGLFFGVTVAPDYAASQRARRLLYRFRVALWICTGASVALAAVAHRFGWALALEGAGMVIAAVNTHHAARRDAVPASGISEIDLAAPPERLPGGVPAILLPLAALAGAGIWASLHLRDLPPQLPVHGGLGGTPDRWIATDTASVLQLLALSGFQCLLLAGIAWGVLHWSRRIAAAGRAAASERRFRRRIVRLLLVCEYFLALRALLALFGAPVSAMRAWAAALLATVIVLMIDLIRAGQGGSREAASSELPGGDRTDDACWKLGIIYFNRADPSLLVEKRWGIGYTLNFGNPWAWTLLVAVVAVPVILGLLRTRR